MNHTIIIADGRLWADAISLVLGDKGRENVAVVEPSMRDGLSDRVDPSDTVVIEYDSKDMSCLATARELSQRHPGLTMIVVGVPDNPRLILSYLENGCTGYVRSSDSLDRLQEILLSEDGMAIDSHVVTAMLGRLCELHRQVGSVPANSELGLDGEALTTRELEVLQLVGEGLTNQEIADRLFIEVGTTKNHVHNVLRKLDARDRQEAAQYLRIVRASQELTPSDKGWSHPPLEAAPVAALADERAAPLSSHSRP